MAGDYIRWQLRKRGWTALQTFVYLHQKLCHHVVRKQPLPVGYWRALRFLLRPVSLHNNPLVARPTRDKSAFIRLPPELSNDREAITFSDFTLDPDALTLLWDQLNQTRPRRILEFGSGMSTVMLARYSALVAMQGGTTSTIVSLEQDRDSFDRTAALLERSGLRDRVKLFLSPVDQRGAYQVAPEVILDVLDGYPVEWLLIDGPRGPAGCRVHTLGRYHCVCAVGAQWFLDDAFRDGELQVLSQWQNTSTIQVHGIYPLSRGLATGRIQNRSSAQSRRRDIK